MVEFEKNSMLIPTQKALLNNENCYFLCVLEHQKCFFEIYFISTRIHLGETCQRKTLCFT